MRIVPVNQGEIQTEIQSMTPAGLRKFTHIITSGWSHGHAVISRCLGVKHAESVMMLCREHNRTHAGLLRQKSNLVCIEFYRIELICSLCIPIRKNARKRLNLFTVALTHRFTIPDTSKMGIQAEMNEHGIFVRRPSLEARSGRSLSKKRIYHQKRCRNSTQETFHIEYIFR